MQIVIDLPNRYYEMVKDFDTVNIGRCQYKGVQYQVINAIKNGKPLPKGHGRLIDSDDMIDDLQRQCKEVFKLDAVKPEDYYIAKDAKFMQATWKEWCDSFCVWANNRKTIVEADGGAE